MIKISLYKATLNILISSFIFISCSYNIDYPYESSSNKMVVNCILYPDSIINLSLSYPGNYPSNDTNFTLIKSAKVKFFENNTLIDSIIFDKERERYILDFKPQAGNNYSVSIVVPGQPEVFAQTYIPDDFVLEACYQPLKQNTYRNEVKSHLSSLLNDESYWIYFLSDDYSYFSFIELGYPPGSKSDPFVEYIKSYDRVFDDFNTLFDKDGSLEYENILRLPNLGIDFYDFGVYSSNSSLWPNRPESIDWQKDKFQMIVVKASKEADVYWKSVFLNHINKNWEIPNPFYEPVIVPSNIVNGTGVFAGVNSKSSFVFNYPCE